jgi:hypothetical protein
MRMDNQKKIENMIKLLQYHRNAMENRRIYVFKAFISIVIIYLIIDKSIIDYVDKIRGFKWMPWIIICVFTAFLIAYIFFVIQTERANIFNKNLYIKIHNKIYFYLMSEKVELKEKGKIEKAIEAWGTTWSIFIAIIIFAFSVYIVLHFTLQR